MHFTDIYILESLPGGFARRTGKRLFEELEGIVHASTRKANLHHAFVTRKSAFLEALGTIAATATEGGSSPLLHLETHGSPDGLTLASEELVTWQALQPALTAINIAGRLNLVVMVAACHGLDLLKIVRPTDRAPARLIIGPNRVLDDREVEAANQAFYRTLFETFDGVKAHQAMNDAIEPPSDTRQPLFYAMSAEQMFFLTVAGYFDDCRDDATIERRIDERIELDLASGEHPELADPLFRANWRTLFRTELTNHRQHFEYYRRLFFFCDLQPENDARFAVTFEQCWNLQPGT